MPPPVGFDFETAKEILRLVKKNKNGSLNRPIESETPNLNNPQMVFANLPEYQQCSYDDDIKAWLCPTAITYYPLNIGDTSTGLKQFGETDDDGLIMGGITAKIYIPKFGNEETMQANAGFHMGFIFGYDDSEVAMVLIARPINTTGTSTLSVVTDVILTPSGIEVSTATLVAQDYFGVGSNTFLALEDVDPITFAANQGRVVKVNDAADGLEFGPIVDAEYTTFIALSDTPASFGASKADAYKTCIVGSDGVSIVFANPNVEAIGTIEGGGNPFLNFTPLQLANDESDPATDTFYGVDDNGDKGWRTIEITTLSDFPSMVGNGEYFLKVNSGEDGIEFVAVDIQQILDDVASLQTDVATLQSDVATLQADYITLEARVTALE